MIDLVRWIGGPVASVTAHVATLGHVMEAEDTAAVSLRFANGTLGSIVATTCANPELPAELRVYGDLGHVRIVGEDGSGVGRPGRSPRQATADDQVPTRAGDGNGPDVGDERDRIPPPVRGLRRCRPIRVGHRSSPVRTGETPSSSSRRHTRPIARLQRPAREGRTMKVGTAIVDITPPLGMQLEGFEVRVAGATGIHDPLHARALVAEGADGTTVALVVADLIQIDARLQGLIADRGRDHHRDPPRTAPARRDPYAQRPAVARAVRGRADDRPRDRGRRGEGVGGSSGCRRGGRDRPGDRHRGEPAAERRAGGRPGDRHPVRRPGGPADRDARQLRLPPDDARSEQPPLQRRLPGRPVPARRRGGGRDDDLLHGATGRRQPRRLLAGGQHGRRRRPVEDVRVGRALRPDPRRLRAWAFTVASSPGPSDRAWGDFAGRRARRKRLPDAAQARAAAATAPGVASAWSARPT